MQSDLGFSDAAYGVVRASSFSAMCCSSFQAICCCLRVRARKTFSRILVLWGITSCMRFVHAMPPTFYAMRFLLGVFEAGFAPGMIYYLSCWYGPQRAWAPPSRSVFRAGPIGGIVGGPASAWLR
ncbi:MFS transporter [Cupriavidus basilensis]